jgi:uncharacterized protein YhjY with autotransporter beta-barrel domain
VLRQALLATAGGLALATVAGQAFAQTAPDWSGVVREAQAGTAAWSVERDPQIVIANPNTPTTARDPENITGVGQMIVDEQNGFIGLCTATLINPRTVILAAHCVNAAAPGDYGAATGGKPIGFGFSNDNYAGLIEWIFGDEPHQTSTANAFYNANYVSYHQASLEPEAHSFLYGDVAVASLDTAAGDIPTWSLLFSALPANETTAAGTGYHVGLAGYGNNGTATTGSTGGIDFRRRLAENMLGGLASLDDFEGFLFGFSEGLPQNLYWIDFDDPRRGTGAESIFDFNAWRDNGLPNEGITAEGDSGGPLILDDAFDKPVVIGVLSGGYTRFFNGQPANGYGTASFFQPLFLYWDWIAANNPYHYVSALAGDGDWTDPTHWTTNLDPNYQIVGPDGELVNGLPTAPGAGPDGSDDRFGQMCIQGPAGGGYSDCLDVATGDEIVEMKPIGTGASDSSATVSADGLAAGRGTLGFGDLDPVRVAQAGGSVTTAALPAATLLNGLPGASNFTPDNDDGDRTTATPPRYFDVTLSANGTTTLDSAVTIDRLTIAGAGAGLDITSGGSLTSNIDITQLIGTLNVDGELRTPGDMFMMAGGLSGGGQIYTPYFTNLAGVIAPGGVNTVGTLTFNGNLILSSASALLINLGADGVSDRVDVVATDFDNDAPLDGMADLGGLVAFGVAGGSTPRDGDVYTFLTAEGGITGGFDTVSISAILTPTLTYGANAVTVSIEAGDYADVVTGNPIQSAYAQLLDQNRSNYDELADVFGPMDLMDAASIQATLDGLAPRVETLKGALGTAAMSHMTGFYRDRLATAWSSDMGGSVEVTGRPVEYALASLDPLGGAGMGASPVDGGESATIMVGALPGNMRGYLTTGFMDGRARSMPGTTGGDDEFEGSFFAAGLEAAMNDHLMAGVSLSSTGLSGDTSSLPQSVDGDMWQAAVYAGYQGGNGMVVDGQFGYGRFDTDTLRLANIGGTVYQLKTSDEAETMMGEIGVGMRFVDRGWSATPRASLTATQIDYGTTTETGGGPALTYERDNTTAIEGRLGYRLAGETGGVRPSMSFNYVHAFSDDPTVINANFVGGVGPYALFPLTSQDKDWVEIGLGLDVARDNWRVGVAADATLAREDVENRSIRASVSFRF